MPDILHIKQNFYQAVFSIMNGIMLVAGDVAEELDTKKDIVINPFKKLNYITYYI